LIYFFVKDLLDSTKQTASAAADRAHAAANTTGQAQEKNQQEAAGFLQQVILTIL
jgi:hypothetical protein